MNRKETVELVEKNKAVAVIRLADPNTVEPVLQALYEGGVKVMEITMTVPNAVSLIRKAVGIAPDDMILGVGTVINAKMVQEAVDAGARFVVSPVMKEEIIRQSHEMDVPVMPGAFTPTEIQTAWELGADVVKVFPANIVGKAFFKNVLAPLPHLKLMPTGGVSLTNGKEWIEAGACAVGLGSALLDKKAIAEGNFDQIKKNAETLMSNL